MNSLRYDDDKLQRTHMTLQGGVCEVSTQEQF
jgi:hypothetical protein